MVLHHQPQNRWKKGNILNLQNEATLMVKTFRFITQDKCFPDKHFGQNTNKEKYKKNFSENSNSKKLTTASVILDLFSNNAYKQGFP